LIFAIRLLQTWCGISSRPTNDIIYFDPSTSIEST
jgi:hypothetical protein